MAKFQFMDLADLQLFKTKLDTQIQTSIDGAVSTAIRTVSLSADGLTMYFYRKDQPVNEAEAIFSIPLPKPVDITGKADKVSTAKEGDLAALNSDGNLVDSGKKVTDFATAEQGAAADEANEIAKKNKTDIEKINNETTGILVTSKKYTDDKIAGLRIEDYAKLNYVDEQLANVYKKNEIDAVVKGINEAIADVSAYIGTIPPSAKSKDVVSYVTEVANNVSANGYDDTPLKDRVSAVEEKVDILTGDGEGSVHKQVADAVAQIVANAPEAYDTLKEISDWILDHASDAASMNSQINTNKKDIQDLKNLIGELPSDAEAGDTLINYLMGYADKLVEGLDLDSYAKQSDLDSAVSRISANETAIGAIKTALAEGGEIKTAIDLALNTAQDAQQKADSLKTLVGELPTEGVSATTVVGYVDEKTTANTAKISNLESRVSTNESNISKVTKIAEGNQTAIDIINDPASGILAQAKKDATSKANTALSDAKEYTDLLKNGTVANNSAGIIQNANDIDALEALVGEGYESIPISEIEALFNKD